MSKGFINKMTKGIAVVLALSLLMVQGTFAGDRFHKASDGSETAVPAYDASGHLIGKGSGSKEASAHIMNDPVEIKPAIDLKWVSPGVLQFNSNNAMAFQIVNVYCDGTSIGSYHATCGWVGEAPIKKEDANGIVTWDVSKDFSKSGIYTFKVSTYKDDSDEERSNGVDSEESQALNYTLPEQKLQTVTRLWWNEEEDGLAEWEGVPNAKGYYVYYYGDGIETNQVATRLFADEPETKASILRYIGNNVDKDYSFAIQAVSKDLNIYANSDLSERSDAIVVDSGKQKKMLDASKAGISGEVSPQEAQAVIEQLQRDVELSKMQLAMQTKEAVRDSVKQLEDLYMEKANITVSNKVAADTGINGSKVKIIGASLNAGAGSNVAFNIGKAEEKDSRVLPPAYTNVARFDMDIDGAANYDKETGLLAFPVDITIPVPDYFGSSIYKYIIHYHHADDGYDIIKPRENDDGTLSFTITHFSEIAIAGSNTDVEGGENNQGGNDQEGSTQPPAAEKPVTLEGGVVSFNGIRYYLSKNKVGFSDLFDGASEVTSSDTKIAKINKRKKIVTFNKDGEATLTADDGREMKIVVFGNKAQKMRMAVGEEKELPEGLATATNGGIDVNNTSKAEISESGMVKALAAGKVKLSYKQGAKKRVLVKIVIK